MPIRQLAAILFVDIVGYTGMMQEDETRALQALGKFRKKLEEVIAGHDGRIIEFRGDGALCSFRSTHEAVRASLSFQIDMRREPMVPVRMAIHTGDIILEGDIVYGDGVNIASRIETLTVPGSIFISSRVHEDIKNQKDFRCISLGKYKLKNVKEELELFAISHPGIVVPDHYILEGKGYKSQNPSILVLPFLNLSNDPEQEYFSDGLTEELTSSLSRLRDIKVISRTTSMKYKGTNTDLKSIARETGATYVLEGSVRTQGNKLRITAQIIDAAQDQHIWADNYQGTLDDVFDIQEKVASRIAEALHLQLTKDEQEYLQHRYTANLEAYQLYLQGRFFWNKRNEESMHKAIQYFEKAIEKDPSFALAWAGIADGYNLLGEYTDQSRQQLHPKAKAAAHKALEIDPALAEAHASLGSLLMVNEWDWEQAEREFRIALELNPNYATCHHWYSELLLFKGFKQEALDEIALAVELDPVSMAILKDQGIAYYYVRQYDTGIEKALTSLTLDPDFIPAHRLLSLCYAECGRYEEALEENRQWGRKIHNSLKPAFFEAYILAKAGQATTSLKILQEALTQPLGPNDARSVAQAFGALGNIEKGFEWLEKSYTLREEALCSLLLDPKMDPFRGDPRFDALVKKIGL